MLVHTHSLFEELFTSSVRCQISYLVICTGLLFFALLEDQGLPEEGFMKFKKKDVLHV